MNYQSSNSSTKNSRSDNDISLADDSPAGKCSSPLLLLDERLRTIHKISTNSLRRLLQTEKEFFDVVLNAARKVCDQEHTHQNVRDLFRIGINRARLATAAVQAWKSQYIGNYPAAIIAEIENHLAFSKLDGHGYIGAMIQSSGTGKSRTMHEIAVQIFTIPINIREYSTYPDPDTELRNYLIYPHVREVLKTLGGDKTEEDTALRWKSYLAEGNNREILYGNITREARRVRPVFPCYLCNADVLIVGSRRCAFAVGSLQ
ncbi:hypothetical protein DFS33DRAFT_1329571 [Desarmillaria ectypa]|nr:hypothetical protein DFS33DRAFT_1329571 [Desarmillaria ectypa]